MPLLIAFSLSLLLILGGSAATVEESQTHHVYKTLELLGFNGRCFTARFEQPVYARMRIERLTQSKTQVLRELVATPAQDNVILWATMWQPPQEDFSTAQKDYPVRSTHRQIVCTLDYTSAGVFFDIDPKAVIRQSFATASKVQSAAQSFGSVTLIELKSEATHFAEAPGSSATYRVQVEFSKTPFPK